MRKQLLIFSVLFFAVLATAEYIPEPYLTIPEVQPYCLNGCTNDSPIIVPELYHTWDPVAIGQGNSFGSWPTTAAAASASGWTVPATCVANVGRIAVLTANPQYPIQLRYDSGGFLAGMMFISENPQGWPFELRVNLWTAPLWVADVYWRTPSSICTNAGRAQIDKLIFRETNLRQAEYEVPTDAAEAQLLGWYDTGDCIPFMGVHFFWVPKVTPGPYTPSVTNAGIDLVLLFSLDRQHFVGYEFLNIFQVFNPVSPFPAPDLSTGVWEIDAARPNKPFDSYSLHVFTLPWGCPNNQCPPDTLFGGPNPAMPLPHVVSLLCFNMYETPAGPQPFPYGFPYPQAPAADAIAANTVRIPPDPRWRTYDGFENNMALDFPNDFPKYWGIPGGFAHLSGISYKDGVSVPRDGPNPRVISNSFFSAPNRMATSKINDMHTYWGMLMTTDLCATERDLYFSFTISVPQCDPFMDPSCTGTQTFSEVNAGSVPHSGSSVNNPKLAYNMATSYLDLNQIYGRDGSYNCWVRTFTGGELRVDDTEVWYGQAVGTSFPYGYNPFVRAGDIRMNKSPPLISYHKIFRREHNRKARELAAANPTWSDEEIFQYARLWTIAVYQSISTHEYTAALLGEPLPPYSGYNSTLDATCSVEFCHAAFRYGHSELNKIFMRMDQNFEQDVTGHVLMRDVLWSQMEVNSSGIEPVLRGMITQQQSAADLSFIDDVRHLYSLGPTSGLDLPAINVMRGRDVGMPTYNTVRQAYGLPIRTSWDEITPDPDIQAKLVSLYGAAPAGINGLDLYVGALAEPTMPSSAVGETFWNIIRSELIRIRDGDRYWYENLVAVSPDLPWSWTAQNVSDAQSRKLEDVIEDNTEIEAGEMGSGIFFLKSRTLEALSAQGAFEQVTLSDFDLQLGFTEETVFETGGLYNIYWRMDRASGESSNVSESNSGILAQSYKNPQSLITFMLKGKATGWFGMGFHPDNPGSMKGADLYFCRVWDINSTAECRDSFALDVGPPRLDEDTGLGCTDSLYYGPGQTRETADLRYFGGYQDGAETTIWFTRRFDTGDEACDKVIPYNNFIQLIFAFNPNTDEMKYHGPTRSATQQVNFFSGQYEVLEEDATPVGLLIALGICGSLGIIFCFLLIILILVKTEHFRFMAPQFCICILIGAIVCYSAMLTLLQNPVNTASCTVYIWLAGVGFSFMFACLFAKTFRIWRLLSSKSMKASQISTTDMAIWISVLVLIEIIFLAIWTGVDMPTGTPKVTPYDDTKYSYYCECNDGWWGAYAGIYGAYILAGIVFTFLTRNLPPEFNDSKPIGWSMYNLGLIWAMAVGLGFGLEQWQSARVAVMAFTIFIALTFTLIALFGHTIWRILKKKSPRTFKTTMNMGSSSRGSTRGPSTSSSTTGPHDSTLDD